MGGHGLDAVHGHGGVVLGPGEVGLDLGPVRQHHSVQPDRVALRHRLRVEVVDAADVLLVGLELGPLHPPLALAQFALELDGLVVLAGSDLHPALTGHYFFQLRKGLEQDSPHVGVVDVGVHWEGHLVLGVADAVTPVEEDLG